MATLIDEGSSQIQGVKEICNTNTTNDMHKRKSRWNLKKKHQKKKLLTAETYLWQSVCQIERLKNEMGIKMKPYHDILGRDVRIIIQIGIADVQQILHLDLGRIYVPIVILVIWKQVIFVLRYSPTTLTCKVTVKTTKKRAKQNSVCDYSYLLGWWRIVFG